MAPSLPPRLRSLRLMVPVDWISMMLALLTGYNLPMMISPRGGTGGNCRSAGCAADLNGDCPVELKVVDGSEGVACKSACDAFGDPQYCCSGAYATPNTCKPSSYSQFFKTACPTAYSYAYDDGTSTFTCAAADYDITFCPSPAARSKSLETNNLNYSFMFYHVMFTVVMGTTCYYEYYVEHCAFLYFKGFSSKVGLGVTWDRVKSSNPMAVDISSAGPHPASSALIGGAIATLAAI
ncbi:Thaumatin-like protein 1 [Hibiscus syriacus]|uniref:Thaumatin-like protein 1 n=1 Tax=Hibiscus syriacus TaxID=106335 RepID=A0A6A2ZT45_HIBSY|nr:Thaumatin-like protein 1 [Hibiscus syriacus]